MARMTKEQKAAEQRIERVYGQRCSNIPISVLKIGDVFKVGQASIANGDDDTMLGDKIAAFVETIREDA